METCTRDDRRRLGGDSGCTGVTETCTRDDRRRLRVTVGVQGWQRHVQGMTGEDLG